jgi:hypothetical protein
MSVASFISMAGLVAFMERDGGVPHGLLDPVSGSKKLPFLARAARELPLPVYLALNLEEAVTEAPMFDYLAVLKAEESDGMNRLFLRSTAASQGVEGGDGVALAYQFFHGARQVWIGGAQSRQRLQELPLVSPEAVVDISIVDQVVDHSVISCIARLK